MGSRPKVAKKPKKGRTCARGIVADRDGKPMGLGPAVPPLSVTLPPQRDGIDSKRRGLMAGPCHHETLIPCRIVNAIRDGHDFGVAAEVVIHDPLRLLLPASPRVLEISDHFLFFASTLMMGFPCARNCFR